MVHRCLNFDDSTSPTVDANDAEEEEDFPTASLDDLVWSEEPLLDRDLCIHMALRKSETSYPFQIPTPLQEHSRNLVSVLLRNLWTFSILMLPWGWNELEDNLFM